MWRGARAAAVLGFGSGFRVNGIPNPKRCLLRPQEYFKAVDVKQLKAPVLTMTFRDSSTVYVKQVRGGSREVLESNQNLSPKP